MFIDRVSVELYAGKGGNGAIAWRREKYIPKGGPSGGDGGKGGSIVVVVDPNTHSLDHFKHTKIIKASDGVAGKGGAKNGKNGVDLTLQIPPGTIVRDSMTGEILFDGVTYHEEFLVCAGGKGGKGNIHFKSPTNQAPNMATPGVPGVMKTIEFELKLIADIGLVGFPNAGKSSLLSALTNHHFKTGPYPFTTLHPNLGYVVYPGAHRVVFADIPGIIEGAHENRGLGFEFLRHIERTKALLYVLDVAGSDGRSAIEDFEVLQQELTSYDQELLKRPFCIALNKQDLPGAEEGVKEFYNKYPQFEKQIFTISAFTGEGTDELKRAVGELVSANL